MLVARTADADGNDLPCVQFSGIAYPSSTEHREGVRTGCIIRPLGRIIQTSNRTHPTDCGFRFSVTRIDRSSASLTLGLDFISQYGGWCRGFVDDPSASHSVWFVWRPGPGLPTPEGIPVLLTHETVGPGTYRIWEFGPWIFDVPPGSSITLRGFFEHTDEGHDPDPVLLTALMIFHDGNVTSSLHIDPHTGLEDRRTARTAKAHEVFDHIINSMRLAE